MDITNTELLARMAAEITSMRSKLDRLEARLTDDGAPPDDPLIDAKRVAALTGFTAKSIRQWAWDGGPSRRFPAPVQIPGTRDLRWRRSTIEDWIEGRTPERRPWDEPLTG